MTTILILSVLLPIISAQQIPSIRYPFENHGLSPACLGILNTTVRCPKTYADTLKESVMSLGVPLLDRDSLLRFCSDICHDDLTGLRDKAVEACTSPQDVLTYESVVYPATYFVDAYLYMHDVACYKSPGSHTLCGLAAANSSYGHAINNSNATEDDCDDCSVGPMSVALELPIGYESEYASQFSSVTSSCGLHNYSITTPTSYALSTTTTSPNSTNQTTTTSSQMPTTTTPVCQSTYTLQAGDTCDSIAEAMKVSTFGLIQANNLDIDCETLNDADTARSFSRAVCLPKSCRTHQLWYGDTCASLTAAYGITMVQLLTWNQNIDRQCINIERWRGTRICIGNGTLSATSSLATSLNTPVAASATRTAAPVPSNAYSNATRDCASWHSVVQGDTCAEVSLAAQITLNELLCLNPGLNRNCTNLMLGVSYCIAASGPSETCAGNPGQPTTITTTFTRPAPPSWTLNPETPDPRPSGTLDGCVKYANAFNASAVTDFYADDWANATATVNLCYVVAGSYGVRLSDFLSWNPSLQGGEACQLQVGFSYCVQLSVSSSLFNVSSSTMSSTATR